MVKGMFLFMEGYRTIRGPGLVEYSEKRSRFIGAAQPVTGEEQAQAFLAERRRGHRDARHHCHAYILRGGGVQRCSDDGEPQGTAGVPMLEVLRKNDVCDLVVVVTRYFGGVLLGAGGLVRAYSHTAALAVEAAGVVRMEPWTRFCLCVDYGFYGRLAALLETHRAVVENADFAERVSLEARIPQRGLGAFAKELTEASSGGVVPEILGQAHAEM